MSNEEHDVIKDTWFANRPKVFDALRKVGLMLVSRGDTFEVMPIMPEPSRAFKEWWFKEETVAALERARTVEEECRIAWAGALASVSAPAQPLLVRDVAEMLGIDSSMPVCKALVARGYPPRSVNMAVTPDEAVAVAKHLAAQPSAQGEAVSLQVTSAESAMQHQINNLLLERTISDAYRKASREALQSMIVSAVQIVDGEVVIGYQIKTGALHKLVAVNQGDEDGVFFPTNLPTLAAPAQATSAPLVWTEPSKPTQEVPYDHCTAFTPFGRFLITWKSWKDNYWPTVDETPWGEFFGSWPDLEEAKTACEAEFARRLGLVAASLPTVTNEMVSRFLQWSLPKDFCPDCGISFDGRKDDEWNKNKTWPIGTNLLTAEQARSMLTYVLTTAE